MHVVGCRVARGQQRFSPAQIRRDRRCQRASGAVCGEIESLVDESLGSCDVGVAIHHRAAAGQVPAFQQYSTWSQRQQFGHRSIGRVCIGNRVAQQQFGFGNIRRQDGRQWNQPRAQCIQRVGFKPAP